MISHRGGLVEKSGPGVTVRLTHSIQGALPTQCIARIERPTWKNTHTLNIILDAYKEITSYIYFLALNFRNP